MAGGGSFASDQKFTTLTADGRFKTITGGSVDIGPCRVTYIFKQQVLQLNYMIHQTACRFFRVSIKFWNRRL